ncbi:MAG: hypothetical protein HY343_10105 [Lentisphaerae bacterium]|nr:hypothetical protein [Lentisphaerota bacterium]
MMRRIEILNSIGIIMVCLSLVIPFVAVAESTKTNTLHLSSSTNTHQNLMDSRDYSGILDGPEASLSIEEKQLAKSVRSSNVPTAIDAWRKVEKMSEDMLWTRDARTLYTPLGLRKLMRDIQAFGKKGELVWVVDIKIIGQYHQVFLVHTVSGEVIELLP